MPLPAIAAGALKIGAVIGKAAGATVKGVAAGAKTMGKVGAKVGKSTVKGTKSFGKSLSDSGKSVKKAVIKRTKIKKETFTKDSKFKKKLLEKKKKREEEQKLEKPDNKNKKPDSKKAMNKGGSVLQKLINFIGTILIGWVVNKLPEIVEKVKKMMDNIKKIIGIISPFFSGFSEFVKSVGSFINKTWETITSIKFEDVKNTLTEWIDKLKNGFKNIVSKIGEGIGIIKKKEKEDPKKLAKEGGLFTDQGPQDPEKPKELETFDADVKNAENESALAEKEWKDKQEEISNIDFDKELSVKDSKDSKVVTPTETVIPKNNITTTVSSNAKSIGSIKKPSSTDTKTNKKPKSKTIIRSADDTTREGSIAVAKEKAAFAERMSKRRAKRNKLEVSKPITQSTASITPENRGEDIVVIGQDPSPKIQSGSGGNSSPTIIIERDSLNSLTTKQFLTKLA